MYYASVCDGIGAAHVAWQPLGWKCQWTSEIEPFPVAVVEHHYGFRNLGDMTKITEDMIDEPVDLLVGGTPCQSFSVAGLRGGLADPRGNLALRFVQLAAVMQPQWIVWENVPGVLSSGKGRDFGTFLGALGELGYGFAYRVLDAQWFGVAQRRRRVFVVGHLGDWRRAAAVLFERESVFGNPPTRGAAWEGVARSTAASLTSSGRGVERCGESRGQDDVVVAAPQVANPLTARLGKGINTTCDEGQTPIVVAEPQAIYSNESRCDNIPPAGLSPPLKIGSNSGVNPPAVAVATDLYNRAIDGDVAHSIRAGNGNAMGGVPSAMAFKPGQSEAAGSTFVTEEFAPTMQAQNNGSTAVPAVAYKPFHYTRGKDGAPSVVAAPLSADADKGDQDTVVAIQDCGSRDKKQNGEGWKADGTAYTVDAAATQGVASNTTVVAFKESQSGCRVGRVHATLDANEGSRRMEGVMTPMAVRRLTPRECERLQGFPDDYTLVTYRGKPAADGPRYRALGNSMAVPVMRWIGERIVTVEAIA